MDELSPEAEAKDMELVATRGEDEQGKRAEFSPPLGGNETERTLRRRGPPCVAGSVSRRTPERGHRTDFAPPENGGT